MANILLPGASKATLAADTDQSDRAYILQQQQRRLAGLALVGARVVIDKGCVARHVRAHTSATVVSVTELGPDYAHSVKVVLRFINGFQPGVNQSWYARHINRLSDAVINLNDGNPHHTIKIRVVKEVK